MYSVLQLETKREWNKLWHKWIDWIRMCIYKQWLEPEWTYSVDEQSEM